jgi:riboflavin synthase
MFTGLITEIGTLLEVRRFEGGRRLTIGAPRIAGKLLAGESIACDGVCLTVETTDPPGGAFRVAAVEATLRRATVGLWRRGRRLHLERALAVGDRLGGHWVQGHVDGIARIVRAGRERGGYVLWLHVPAALQRYVVPRGSLAVDGVSLTIAARRGPLCGIALVPETLARTRLGACRPGDRVNLEVDPLTRIVESLLAERAAEAGESILRRTTS